MRWPAAGSEHPECGHAAFDFRAAGRAGSRAAERWPLDDQYRRFDLGHVLNCAITDTIEPASAGSLSVHHAGLWECDLASGRLIWSGGVYDMFGLERGQPVSRERALSRYSEESRVILERLRSDAIEMRHGFTADVEIYPELGETPRWIRIIAAPVVEHGAVRRLHGLKLSI